MNVYVCEDDLPDLVHLAIREGAFSVLGVMLLDVGMYSSAELDSGWILDEFVASGATLQLNQRANQRFPLMCPSLILL